MRPSLDLRAGEAVATRPADIDLDDLDVGDMLASHRRRAHEDLAVRDQRIAEFEQELQQTRNQLAASYQRHARHDARSSASWQTRLDRGQRRLSATRADRAGQSAPCRAGRCAHRHGTAGPPATRRATCFARAIEAWSR